MSLLDYMLEHKTRTGDLVANCGGIATFDELVALTHLAHRELQMAELAADLSIKPSQCTTLVDRMYDKKLVDRRQSKSDRRIWIVSLTDEGQRIAQMAAREFEAVEKEAKE